MIQEGIGESELKFTNAEYSSIHQTVYQMCIQKNPHMYTAQLYEAFEVELNQYLTSVALPACREKSGDFMVKELVRRW